MAGWITGKRDSSERVKIGCGIKGYLCPFIPLYIQIRNQIVLGIADGRLYEEGRIRIFWQS